MFDTDSDDDFVKINAVFFGCRMRELMHHLSVESVYCDLVDGLITQKPHKKPQVKIAPRPLFFKHVSCIQRRSVA